MNAESVSERVALRLVKKCTPPCGVDRQLKRTRVGVNHVVYLDSGGRAPGESGAREGKMSVIAVQIK